MNLFKHFDAIIASINIDSQIAEDSITGVNSSGEQENISTPTLQLEVVRRMYEGTDEWMVAPNGKKSKLNERQWLQVRTPNFKRWFGDWENDPQNASKVLDDNGEPMVVYHGTNIPLNKLIVFKAGEVGWLGPGIYLTPFAEYAKQFSDQGTGGIVPLFLNMRNPLVLKTTWRIGRPYLELLEIMYGNRAKEIYHQRYDYVADKDKEILATMPEWKQNQYIHRRIVTAEEVRKIFTHYDGINWDDGEYSIIDPNKIKHATKNNGEFGTNTNNILATEFEGV